MNRYSLCAMDLDNNKEYVINLFNYKNNKSPLSVIDFGTSHFKDENYLINYLFMGRKIPTKNVNLYIKHGDKKIRKLPIIYNDENILKLTNSKNNFVQDDKIVNDSVRNNIINKHMNMLKSEDYRMNFNLAYMFSENYMSDRFFSQTDEFYRNYINVPRKNTQLKSNTFDILKSEVKSYKAYRTLYYTIKYGANMDVYKKNNENKVNSNITPKKYVMSDEEIIHEENMYYGNDMDEFYSVYDLDNTGKKL